MPIRAAISNARTLESTSWNLPSISATLKSITGKPASGPLSMTDLMPFSTPGMYSFGTAPPTMRDSNEYPSPGSGRGDLELDLGELTGAARLLLVRYRCARSCAKIVSR